MQQQEIHVTAQVPPTTLTEGHRTTGTAAFADRALKEVLTALASDATSPGSGAAAAATLALAAACAGKALAISRKHRAADESTNKAQRRLGELVGLALGRADVDSALFEKFIHDKSEQAASELLRADAASQALARELDTLLNEIEGTIHPGVMGDIAAARVLLSAASLIQARIRAENQRAARASGSHQM
jgi:formiminotetrahydrofolate cyclodeaminase